MFDINTEYKFRHYLSNNCFVNEYDDIFYVWRNTISKKFIDFDIDFFVREGDTYNRIKETQRQYIYKESEIEEIIEASNLQIVNKYDFETFSKVKRNSLRILYIIKRK